MKISQCQSKLDYQILFGFIKSQVRNRIFVYVQRQELLQLAMEDECQNLQGYKSFHSGLCSVYIVIEHGKMQLVLLNNIEGHSIFGHGYISVYSILMDDLGIVLEASFCLLLHTCIQSKYTLFSTSFPMINMYKHNYVFEGTDFRYLLFNQTLYYIQYIYHIHMYVDIYK